MPRPNNAFMDAAIDGEPIRVLDHGFIRVVDYMGDEAAIVQAARVSYGAGTKTVSEDRGLLRYLMRHRHTTPYEMCEIKLHCKMPIFIARQWIRHRTANVNEYSARYSILDREFYLPEPHILGQQSTNNKQGRAGEVPADYAAQVLRLIKNQSEAGYESYRELLNDDGDGNPADPGLPMLARELARMNLTLNFYTQWYWKIDLHNLLHFLSLRHDKHAQYEIRAYAEPIFGLVRGWMPNVAEAFEDFRLDAVSLSRLDQRALRYLLLGQPADDILAMLDDEEIEEIIPNRRERQEFVDKVKKLLT